MGFVKYAKLNCMTKMAQGWEEKNKTIQFLGSYTIYE